MGAGRIIAIIAGALLGLIGLGMAAGAGVALWAHETQRDAQGFFTAGPERLSAPGRAIVSDEIELGAEPSPGWLDDARDLVEVRVRAAAANPADRIFVGVAPADDARRYLEDAPYAVVEEIDLDPLRVRYRSVEGTQAPPPPATAGIWAASDAGAGTREVRWPGRSGRWVLVVMNADASAGVAADVALGVRIGPLRGIAIGLLIAGLVLLGIGAAMIIAALHRRRGPPAGAPAAAPAAAAAPGPEPVALEGVRDADLSRALWLVKWLLLIPHVIVLAVLWFAFMGLTIAAFVAIVFTGRYPRGIFDINVGILRWSWRVSFYGYSALGTDRYPPFSLGHADHPAALDVEYPAHLSRGLVWVKWWLLAIPHYIVLAVLGTGVWWSAGWLGGEGGLTWGVGGAGLIGVLVLIAGVWLLFAGRYPDGLFDFVMGLNRWVYRVIAYAALMTDRYPPFRLDPGPREPAAGDGDARDDPGARP